MTFLLISPGTFTRTFISDYMYPQAPGMDESQSLGDAAGVSSVPDRNHVLQRRVRDDRTYGEPPAGAAFRELLSYPHVDLE